MPWFSKKSKFVKRFESHSKSRTIKAYLHFFLMKKTDLKMSSIMIRARIKQAHGFVICVCLIDGTLFLWPLHPLWTQKIISQGKVTMRLKICLFVIILQRLFGLRWDGLAVYTTIGYGQTVTFICQRKIQQQGVSSWWFSILCIISHGSCFQKGHNSNLSEDQK